MTLHPRFEPINFSQARQANAGLAMMDEIEERMRPYLKKYRESLEPPELIRERLVALAALGEANMPIVDGSWNWPALRTGPTSAWLCLNRLYSLGWKGGIG